MTDFVKATFFALMHNYAPYDPPSGFSDSFSGYSGVDWNLSSGAYYDSQRTTVHNTRSNGASIIHEPFDSISAWDLIQTGTGSASVIASGETDVAVGPYTLEMSTGSQQVSAAGVQRDIGSIPSSFGIAFIPKLDTVGTDLLDAQNIWIENTDNKSFRLRQTYGALKVQADGQWQLLSDHIAAYPSLHGPEWWVECVDIGGGQHTVTAYTGTQARGSVTGTLPTGTGNNGLVQITQQSVNNANRLSKLSMLDIGSTQLPDNMTVVSTAHTAQTSPSTVNIAFLVEDVSVALVPNTNVKASLSNDGGATWFQVTLTDEGAMGWGEIGTMKQIHLLHGSVSITTSGTSIRYKIETVGGGFYPIQGVVVFW